MSMALDPASINTLSSAPLNNAFVGHLLKVQRFMLGRPQNRDIEGHFVCVQVKLIDEERKNKRRLSQSPETGLEWLLVDSTRPHALSYPSFGALIKVNIQPLPCSFCGYLMYIHI